MGRLWLAPLLPSFLQRYPAMHLEVNYSERYVDLVAEGYDAALRIGILSDSRLVAQRLGQHQRILCASPACRATRCARRACPARCARLPRVPRLLVISELAAVRRTPLRDRDRTRVDAF